MELQRIEFDQLHEPRQVLHHQIVGIVARLLLELDRLHALKAGGQVLLEKARPLDARRAANDG